MSKKHFIALADAIRAYNECAFPTGINTASPLQFQWTQLMCLADFCRSQNSRFNRERWIGYIKGENGPSGGAVKCSPNT